MTERRPATPSEPKRETGAAKPKPAHSTRGLAEAAAREARRAEALRANLARRKAQSRGRAEAARPADAEDQPGNTAENRAAREPDQGRGRRP